MQILFDIVGLRTPAGRLLFFFIASVIIFFVPQSWLGEISIWARLGFENAPSVGLTRAYQHFLHLDLSAAWQRNPLIFLVLATGVPLLIKDALALLKQRQASLLGKFRQQNDGYDYTGQKNNPEKDKEN